MRKDRITRQLALLPGYIIILLWVAFTISVLSLVFVASFSTTKEIFTGKMMSFETGIHFENYYKAWTAQNVSLIFGNSLFYASISCVLLIVIAAPCAYALSRFKFFANKIIQTSFVSAMGVPVIMVVLPLFSIVAGMNLLSNGISNRIVLIFLYVGINIPYTVIFLLAFFATIPHSFEEAAAIDGAGPIRTFWTVMFPMAQPGVITVTIFNFITVWNEYFLSLIFGNSDKVRPVAVGLYSMINSMRYTGDWAGMFAAVMIVFLPTFILYIFLSEKIISGVTGGGVKG